MTELVIRLQERPAMSNNAIPAGFALKSRTMAVAIFFIHRWPSHCQWYLREGALARSPYIVHRAFDACFSFWGDGQYPPSDAVYYPLYAKCAELELPLCINTGIPGPPIPGEVQHPMHLDRVCVRFPELRLCMIHGADPWWDVAIRLLLKYANLRLMTSAWSPKRLPESLLHYMRTRGPNKVIYASDWPVLRMRRVIPEARALDLPADVLDNYLYNNAQEFFFGQEH